MKTWNLLVVGVAMAVMAACGAAPGPANVAACKSFINKVKCGSVDISSTFACDSYANTTCDISEYFACVEAAYVCTNGTYDPTKLATASTCASKAVCK